VRERQAEFERIAIPHSACLLRFARRLTGNKTAAEDLVQEALFQAWRGFDGFAPGTNVRAWLFRILINTCHGSGRKARREPVTVPIEFGLRSAGSGHDGAFDFAQAFDQLPEEQRVVLMLAVVEGFTCREVASILTVPIGTVMSRLSRARQALRARLAPLPAAQGVR
jgi:RNA polymerase sigma-70 factor (ECF subfamily)